MVCGGCYCSASANGVRGFGLRHPLQVYHVDFVVAVSV